MTVIENAEKAVLYLSMHQPVLAGYVEDIIRAYKENEGLKTIPRDTKSADVFRAIEKVFGLSQDDLMEDSRSTKRIWARAIYSNIMHKRLGVNQRLVGLDINRERTTVLHACEVFEDLYFSYKSFREKVDQVVTHININGVNTAKLIENTKELELVTA